MHNWSSASAGAVSAPPRARSPRAGFRPCWFHSALQGPTLIACLSVSTQWKMPRIEDDTMAVTGCEAGERARIDLEALDDPGASNDEDDNQQTGGEVLLHA